MQLIGTISGVNTQYTDLNPPSGYVYYQVELVAPYYCAPSMRAGFNSSRSNIASNNTISVKNFGMNSNFKVYPNPAQSFIFIDFGFENQELCPFTIYNMVGEKVLEGTEMQKIDVTTLSNGVYLIEVKCNNNFYRDRFVIQK